MVNDLINAKELLLRNLFFKKTGTVSVNNSLPRNGPEKRPANVTLWLPMVVFVSRISVD